MIELAIKNEGIRIFWVDQWAKRAVLKRHRMNEGGGHGDMKWAKAE
jgi:hypothetical protein